MAALLAISLFGCKAKENTPDDTSSTGESSSITPGASEQGSSQTEAFPTGGTSTQSQGATEPQNTPTTGASNPGNAVPPVSGKPANTSQPSSASPKTSPQAATVIVMYNANGGNVSPSSQTVTQGSNVTLPTPSRTGYNFNGWYTAASGGTKAGGAGGSYKANTTTTLYCAMDVNRTGFHAYIKQGGTGGHQ